VKPAAVSSAAVRLNHNKPKKPKNKHNIARLSGENRRLRAESRRQNDEITELHKNQFVGCISIFCIGVAVLLHTVDHD
jgi:hypothetical protein